MSRPCRFAVLADLHLSDRRDTAAAAALEWAADWLRRHRVEFLAVAGDVTTYGSGPAMAHLLEVCDGLPLPVYHTPGNAERRGGDALVVLRRHAAAAARASVHGGVQVLLPDTSTGGVPPEERAWLEQHARGHHRQRRVVITHYPLDKLRQEDAVWLEAWLAAAGVELLVSGHSHLHRRRTIGACTEVVVRGLDPDKAIGGPPGIDVFVAEGVGEWSGHFVPWSPPLELTPSDLPGGLDPVGWSVPGDPARAARQTLEAGLSCLELRPRQDEFTDAAAGEALFELRQRQPLFLSYHLTNLTWIPERDGIDGEQAFARHLDRAMTLGADHLTVHVPRAPAAAMLAQRGGSRPAEPTGLYRCFAEAATRLLAPAAAGARIAVENLHNPHGTPAGAPGQVFGSTIGQVRCWMATLRTALPGAQIGLHLDVGHARNNGGELDNRQPLGDWYAALGRDILGYHVHQVATDLATGKAVNHRQMASLHGPRISYAGFFWSWSTRQITRGPLFVEVRDEGERWASVRLLQDLFRAATEVGRSGLKATDAID